MATGMIADDADSPSSEETDNSNEAVASDGEALGQVCPSFIHDHRLQRSLLQFEDEEEMEQVAVEARSLSQTLIKFMGDIRGWVPDPSVQHRRHAGEKQPPKAGTGRAISKPDGSGAGWSASQRLYQRNQPAQNQHTAKADYEFKHYNNIKKYSEQYRRENTCGGPLQKLTHHSAFGRSRTIYYAGDATAEAGVEVGSVNTRGGFQQQQTVINRPGPGAGGVEMPSSNNHPIVTYSDISVNSPRYNLLSDAAQRKRSHHTMNLTHLQRNGVDNAGQTLTVYTSRAPALPLAHPTSSSPPKPHFPFFPSQQPLKQLQTASKKSLTPPGLNSTNELLQYGFSLDRTLGTPVTSCSNGISLNPGPYRDFYSQLMHAAHCLRLAGGNPKDFNFELPHWPTLTPHSEMSSTASKHTSHFKKSHENSPSPQVHIKGRGVSASPTHTSKSPRHLNQKQLKKPTPVYSLVDPTSDTKETHFITIEAPTCSPFDTRSAATHPKRTSPDEKKTSYRVTLKDKPAEIKETSSVDIVANSNRPLAVCEVAWF